MEFQIRRQVLVANGYKLHRGQRFILEADKQLVDEQYAVCPDLNSASSTCDALNKMEKGVFYIMPSEGNSYAVVTEEPTT